MKTRISIVGALALLCAPLIACTTTFDSDLSAQSAVHLSPDEHRATLNGANVWYRVAGTRNGRLAPIVYIAGGPGGNSYSFEKVGGPQLERDNLIVYYDQRGTGRSERPASGDYAISTLVDDIEALRKHLGVPRIAVLGHSFGAVLALEYAAAYPDAVEAVVVAGPLWNAPSSCLEHLERLEFQLPEEFAKLKAEGMPTEDKACGASPVRGRAREALTEANMFPNSATKELLGRLETESGLKNTGELGRAVFEQGLFSYRFAGGSKVSAPVLVIGGSEDHAAGLRTQRALAGLFRDGRYIEYAGLGHWMFLENPDRFARDVTAFLQSR